MVITIPFTMIALYYIQKVYVKTSRQLRVLELEVRGPVYSHFLETLEGLSTIRAFGWQNKFTEENIRRLDDSQRPYYFMFCIQRWLALALDLLVAGLATVVVTLATTMRSSTSPGLLGVSLTAVLCMYGKHILSQLVLRGRQQRSIRQYPHFLQGGQYWKHPLAPSSDYAILKPKSSRRKNLKNQPYLR